MIYNEHFPQLIPEDDLNYLKSITLIETKRDDLELILKRVATISISTVKTLTLNNVL